MRREKRAEEDERRKEGENKWERGREERQDKGAFLFLNSYICFLDFVLSRKRAAKRGGR